MYSPALKISAVSSLVLLLFTLYSGYPVVADPTMPMFLEKKIKPKKAVVKAKPKYKELVVTSTLIASQRTIAIVNDKAVTVGDEIDAAVVLKISSNSVTLRRAGKMITLYVNKHDIKRQTKSQPINSGREGS